MNTFDMPVAWQLATLSVDLYDYLMPAIITVQPTDTLAANIVAKQSGRPIAIDNSQWIVMAWALTH